MIAVVMSLFIGMLHAQFASPGFFRISSKQATLVRSDTKTSNFSIVTGSAALAFAATNKNLVLCAAQTTGVSVTGISDAGNNVWTAIPGQANTERLYYAIANNPMGTITATFSALVATSSTGRMTCFEFDGVQQNSPLETSDSVATTSTLALRTLTVSSSPQFIFAYVFTATAAQPGSTLTNIWGGSGTDLAMIAPAPYIGTFKVNFSFTPASTSAAYTMISAAFKLQ